MTLTLHHQVALSLRMSGRIHPIHPHAFMTSVGKNYHLSTFCNCKLILGPHDSSVTVLLFLMMAVVDVSFSTEGLEVPTAVIFRRQYQEKSSSSGMTL